MRLLGEFARCGEWGIASKRWPKVIYNHPLNSGVGYFRNNLKGSNNSLMGKNAGGYLKQKAELGIEENEKNL